MGAPGRGRIFWLFTAAYFLSYFYRSANAVIAPDLAAELRLGAAQLGLMTSLFYAAFAAMQLPLGVALDRWGPRWATPAVMGLAVAGSLLFAAAAGFWPLALGRALIGAGMAGVLMGSLTIFGAWFPPDRFATVSGLLVGLGAGGALLAGTPLAWLNRAVGWRWVFAGGGGVTALVAVAIMAGARNAPPGRDAGPADGAPEPAALRTIFGDARFWRIAPFFFFLGGTFLSFQGLWAGPYLFDAMGLDDLWAGNALLWLGGGAAAGFLASGWLSDRVGIGRTLAAGGALFLACLLGLAARPPVILVFPLYLLFGFAGGFNVMLMAHARRLFPLRMAGQVVTTVNLFGIGGTFLLQWWMGVLVGRFPPDAAGHYPPAAYSAALLFLAAGTGLTWLWYLPLARAAE